MTNRFTDNEIEDCMSYMKTHGPSALSASEVKRLFATVYALQAERNALAVILNEARAAVVPSGGTLAESWYKVFDILRNQTNVDLLKKIKRQTWNEGQEAGLHNASRVGPMGDGTRRWNPYGYENDDE